MELPDKIGCGFIVVWVIAVPCYCWIEDHVVKNHEKPKTSQRDTNRRTRYRICPKCGFSYECEGYSRRRICNDCLQEQIEMERYYNGREEMRQHFEDMELERASGWW